MAEPLLQVKNLCAGYGQVQVLWGADLTVERGSIACLVGSNGAGKSTMLRTISGLIKPSGGRVDLGNRDLTNATPDAILSAGIAHVPEGRRLFKGMSVRDNLLLTCDANRFSISNAISKKSTRCFRFSASVSVRMRRRSLVANNRCVRSVAA
jgi:ABC-type branched-subunit amino acid transport system ATPase component